MRRTARLATVLALGCLVVVLPAQSQPEFSGRWTSAPEPAADGRQPGGARGAGRAGRGRGARVGDMGTGWGETITITQDTTRLTVEYAFFSRGDLQPPLRFTYALDGTPTINAVMMGRGRQEQSSRARWEGDALILSSSYTFVHPATGEPVEGTVTRKLSLSSPTAMIVEVTRSGVLGGPTSTTRTTYRKLSQASVRAAISPA
jgi:hypothetical protein